jgi:hypothetical protein
MDKVNFLHLIGKPSFLIPVLLSVISPASADESLSSSIDCSTVDINYIDDPQWTESERLAAMDKAFFDSLDRFELCNLSNHSNSTSTASENEASGSEGEFSQESVASPLMTGTETESALVDPTEPELYESSNDETNLTPVGSGYGGKKPEDIPDADNDDVIASQIRLAAEIEQDPVKKEKLWNEYRKYKGLPVDDNE